MSHKVVIQMANFNSAAKSAMQIQVILQGSTGYKSFLFTLSPLEKVVR